MNRVEYNESVHLYSDSIYRFILKNIRDIEKAKDIVQDSYLKLWDKKDTVNPQKVKSYLFTTAWHCMIDVIRKDKRQEPIQPKDIQTYSHTATYSDLKEVLDEALMQLSNIQRSVVMLRDYEGYTYQEIGQVLSLSESQVKVYIFRSRKFLKNYLVSIENVL